MVSDAGLLVGGLLASIPRASDGKEWRKREGIEPPETFPPPDRFEVRGATSAPSASVLDVRFLAFQGDNTKCRYSRTGKGGAMRRFLQVTAMVTGLLLTAGSVFAASGFEVGPAGRTGSPTCPATRRRTRPATHGSISRTPWSKDENIPFGEAFLRLGTRRSGRVRAVLVRRQQDPHRQRQFNGTTYSASENVISSLDLKMLDGEVAVRFPPSDVGVAAFNIGSS